MGLLRSLALLRQSRMRPVPVADRLCGEFFRSFLAPRLSTKPWPMSRRT